MGISLLKRSWELSKIQPRTGPGDTSSSVINTNIAGRGKFSFGSDNLDLIFFLLVLVFPLCVLRNCLCTEQIQGVGSAQELSPLKCWSSLWVPPEGRNSWNSKVLLGDGETEALKIQAGGQKGEKGCFPGALGCSLPLGDSGWGQ